MKPVILEGVKEHGGSHSIFLAMDINSNRLVFRVRMGNRATGWTCVDIDALDLIRWLDTGGRELVEEADMQIREGLSK